ncbi:MAG: YfhO family protein [Bacteroidaceae bacterium]|nr:YfhO family protein [Bacteroidaceae bacterium]
MSETKSFSSNRSLPTREGRGWVADVLAVLFFVAVSVVYFIVPIRDGLVLTGHDHTGGVGSGVEMDQYRATHNGERTRWTNTLFCGMPTYQMSPSYRSTETLSTLEQVYQLGLPGLSAYAAYVFMMLLGFYIMLRAFDFRVWMAALGAVLWAFSSYYFIIIQAGHIWKLLTLSFIPPTIGGMVLCYRGRYMLGIVVTGFFTAMQVLSNHVQMSYYFLFVIGFMSLAFLIDAIRQKAFAKWLKATLCFAIGGILGVLINLSNLYHTWEYSKESMRGKSELTQKTKDPADQTTSGLERSYITMWSYGIGETWTLLVPNVKGGASQLLADSETAMKHAKQEFAPIYRGFTQYWGEQPGTSGPVYVGAFVLMLFWLGFFIVKGPMKWCLIAATVLSILLSWGKNFMGFTDFFLDYVPMYDKFRTVASILVIAEFTIPLLAMLALKEIVTNPDCLRGKEDHISRVHYITISFAFTGGMALLFWLMPDVFFGNYVSTSDQMYMQQYVSAGYIPQEMAGQILANMSEMRRAMFTADALRSFIVVAIGTVLLLAYRFQKLKATPMIAGIILLCLVDMWGVNKRYLNDGMFSRPQTNAQAFPETEADKMILQDTDTYYRVLNLSVSTFNDNTTSFYHKSIGGYHPAKLRRYQELIEEHLQGEMGKINQAVVETGGHLEACNGDSLFPVLNMLNTKYVILPLKDNGKLPVQNPWAQGNGWFVEQIEYVPDADAEIAALHNIDLRTMAVVDKQFEGILGQEASPLRGGLEGSVELTSYEANRLAYNVKSKQGGVVIFSEIYYPGWTCTIDGQPSEIARANYVLRAIKVPAGEHEVIMTFDPQTVHITEAIAYSALAVLALMLIGLLGISIYRKKQQK